MNIEIAQTAVGISFLYFVADGFAAGDDDLIAADDPKERLCHSFDKAEVFFIVAGTVAENAGLVGGKVALVAFHADDDILTVVLRGFAHFAHDKGKRGKLRVELGVDFKLHI